MSMTATKMLARDWRGGELGVLVAALVLAVGLVSGISAFTARLQTALEQESHRFLAADQVIRSGGEIPRAWGEVAAEQGLDQAQTLTFPSMVYAGEDTMYLASVKAVSDSYPLRGELTYATGAYGEVLVAPRGPGTGKVWLDSRLFALLNVEVGDPVSIGEMQFTVAAAARTEPDQGASFFGFGPRVLMHMDDIPATGTVQPGSRVEYRYLFRGKPAQLTAFEKYLKPRLEPGQTLIDIEDGQPGIGSALNRAEQFLLLAGSLGVVLAAVAIALAARRFSQRHYDYVAIMKSLGATSGAINRLYGRSLLLLGAIATLGGCVTGWAMQELFFELFADQLPVQPGSSGSRPYVTGGVTALTCLLCFAWPPLYRLGQASPLRVLRRDMPLETRQSLADYALGLIAVSLLMWWYSQDWKLTLAVMAGLAVTVILGLGLALTLLRGGRLLGMSAGSIWRLALAGIQRRGTANALQVVIFAMAIMLLLVLLLVRTSLIDEWQTQLPEGTPNHFIINIAADQVAPIEAMLDANGITSEALYPMIRGRVMSINGEDLPRMEDTDSERYQRGSNFTWSDLQPPGNTLLSGQWWPPGTTQPLVSVEASFAERFELEVDDKVEFLVGATPLSAQVSSIRELEWQSLKPNFFLIFPPAVLANYPATFMTSFHLEAENKAFLNRFVHRYPTVTVIEIDAVMGQIRSIVSQVSAAIELVLGVILAAGALVLIAGVQASVDERMAESAILRTLGARRNLILGGLWIEFSAIGLFAGLLATLAAELSFYILQTYVLEMVYSPTPWVWPLGVFSGMLLIGCLGVFSCRKVVSSPPLAVLREL
jgi:putative ABC transport system permease protein